MAAKNPEEWCKYKDTKIDIARNPYNSGSDVQEKTAVWIEVEKQNVWERRRGVSKELLRKGVLTFELNHDENNGDGDKADDEEEAEEQTKEEDFEDENSEEEEDMEEDGAEHDAAKQNLAERS